MSDAPENSSELDRLRKQVEAMERRIAQLERLVAERNDQEAQPASHRITHWLNETRPDLAPRATSASRTAVASASQSPAMPQSPGPASSATLPAQPIPMAEIAKVARWRRSGARSSRSLETMIGQHWASWVGAIILFLGVIFFLKYAWDRGWIRPSPAARVVAAVGLGIALGVMGEWMHRKHLRGLAASLYGAGVAVVVASLFAANVYFDPPVLGRTTAFEGVLITAAAAIVVALHINGMPVAMLGLLGAYLSPGVLQTGRDESLFLLCYLALLAVAGWALCWLRPRWIPLRWLVLICAWVSMFAWWANLGDRHGHHNLALVFTLFFFTGFLAESVLTLRRRRGSIQPSESPAFLPLERIPQLDANIAITSLLSTAATFGMLYSPFWRTAPGAVGALCIGMAVVLVAAALATPSRAFLVSIILQAGALVTVSVPLLLDQFAITIAWVILAAVLGVLAWQMNLRSVRIWAAVLLALATARLLLFDGRDPRLSAVIFDIFSQPVSRWMLLASTIAVLFHLLAWLRPGRGRWSGVQQWIHGRMSATPPGTAESSATSPASATILDYASFQRMTPLPAWLDSTGALLSILGTVLFAAVLHLKWHGPMVTAGLVAWIIPIAILHIRGREIGYPSHADVLGLLTSARWLAMDNLIPLIDTWKSGSGVAPILNISAICGLALIAIVLALWRIGRSPDPSRASPVDQQTQVARLVWAGLLIFAWLNFEIWRAIDRLDETSAAPLADRGIVKQVAMSVLWASIGFAAVVFGFRKRIAPMRWVALSLLGITLLKILVIDMANVRAIWRILSFLAVGALLLAVSFVYHRQTQSRASEPPSGY